MNEYDSTTSGRGGATDQATPGVLAGSRLYVIVNAGLIGVWAITGAGYFWPGWVLGGWGIGLLFHAWATFGQKPICEDEIRREMEIGSEGSGGGVAADRSRR